MRKYLSIFRICFSGSIQYRAAAIGGAVTQFFWGAMTLLLYRAFYRANTAAFPMAFSQLSTYIWLQQGLLSLFMIWFWDAEILDSIQSGAVAYELARPMDIYNMWFTKIVSRRMARAVLRIIPIVLVTVWLPYDYRLAMPVSAINFAAFAVSTLFGLMIVASVGLLIYVASFYMISSMGLRFLMVALFGFLSGEVIPLAFFPDALRTFARLLPFAQVQEVPLRIYNGQLMGGDVIASMAMQLIWLVILVVAGKVAMRHALKRTVIQGG